MQEQAQPEDSQIQVKLVFRESEIFLHRHISEQLLKQLCKKNLLDDKTLTLFDAEHTTLQTVCLDNANVTASVLKILSNHKILQFEAKGTEISLANIICSFGSWTLSNIQCLSLSGSKALNSMKGLETIAYLRNLNTLNVGNTDLNDQGLEIIANELHRLENLDISGTKVNIISPLLVCKDRIKSLSMYNLLISQCRGTEKILCQLRELRFLDVSEHVSNIQPFMGHQPAKLRVQGLLEDVDNLPHLQGLDLSGRDEINEDLFRYVHFRYNID